ncbi:hypothetical protein [Komagataeibacter kakiaceti]|nr:hypothetical protein [Komagataeibacter kakiaceti]
MSDFTAGVFTGAGGIVILIGILIIIPIKLHALYMAAQLRDRGLK